MSTRRAERLLTAQQVAELLGEHVETVRTRIRKGQIPAVRLTTARTGKAATNASVRVKESDIAAFIDACEPAARSAS